MTTLLLIALAGIAAILGLPWIVEALFGRRSGVWFGLVEIVAIAGLVPYWFFQWNAQCEPGAATYVGNAMIDNDAACRALLFGAPFLLVIVVVSLLLLIPSVAALFLESRKRSARAT
jgi:hypothetical protein